MNCHPLLKVVPLLGGSLASQPLFDVDLAGLSRPPLWEPTWDEYFQLPADTPKNEQGLPSPIVLTSPTREEFFRHARKGYPLVVDDWGKGGQYDGWTGKDFAETFPFGYMKAEYIQDMPGFNPKMHDIKIMDGEQRFNIGSFKPDGKTMWHNFSRPASKRYAGDPLKPQIGPYVWHVKDELTAEQKKLVQAKFDAPAFLDDQLNRDWMNRTFEIWFNPGTRAGAGAHNDGYCESVVSLQLKGDKAWRKMLTPELTILDSFDEFDGGVYEAGKWAPDLGFWNNRQGAVVWPPGYIHETSSHATSDGECGTSITLQFAFPQPVQFLRAFLPRLSISAEVGQCVARAWSGYPTLYVSGIKPERKSSEMLEQLDKILKSVDTDKDGRVTVDEVIAWFSKPEATIRGELRMHAPEHHDTFIRLKAEDTVAYHDMDGDMVASRQELWDSLVQWNVVRTRVSRGLKALNTADRAGVEALERSLDQFRRAPATLPEKLRPELEQLFSLEPGTKVMGSLKGVNSFSDSEFFSEASRDIDRLVREQTRKNKKSKKSDL